MVNLLPVHALGAETDESTPAASDLSESYEILESTTDELETPALDAQIVGEIFESRTEYSKEYLMSNGLNMVVLYPEAVHYKKDNQWAEIDNTLKAVGFGSNAGYTNLTKPKASPTGNSSGMGVGTSGQIAKNTRFSCVGLY